MAYASDPAIWNEAIERAAVILTKDEDFARRIAWETEGPSVVWLRVGNCSNEALARWFDPMVEEITIRLESGERLVEIR